jgi:hypothetical protein
MPIPEPGWEEEGARLSPLLETVSAVVIIGPDSSAAAEVALGAGRAQSQRRRVVIGDLVGEIGLLDALIPRDDPHGLSDSFAYGISLNRVGYPVEPGGELFIMPSGSEPVATETIIGHPRWQRLVAGFREVGALLVLVAHAGAPGLDRLIPMTDGAILLGDTRLDFPAHVIARARPRGPRRVTLTASSSPSKAPPPLADTGTAFTDAPNAPPTAPASPGPRSGVVVAALVALMLITAAVIALSGPFADSDAAPSQDSAVSTPPSHLIASAPAADPPPPVENPADSAIAARYAVAVIAANTSVGAQDNLRRVIDQPAATTAPSIENGSLWYKVFVGAFVERAEAESLLAHLGQSGEAGQPREQIVALPYAFLAADALSVDSARVMRDTLAARGLPVYALAQVDGTMRLYAGAFATPDEAMHMAPVLRAAGLQPRIVYRTGRPR